MGFALTKNGIRGERMPITAVTWIMTVTLALTYIMLNSLDKKRGHQPDRRIENDRRHFSYDRHIPERRSGKNRRWCKEEQGATSD